MIRYYREPTGDYLAVDLSSRTHYIRHQGKVLYEGRATAITNHIGSVCTTAVSPAFLAECQGIKKADVPTEWLQAIWPKILTVR